MMVGLLVLVEGSVCLCLHVTLGLFRKFCQFLKKELSSLDSNYCSHEIHPALCCVGYFNCRSGINLRRRPAAQRILCIGGRAIFFV